jgi:hypothetical protein
MKLASRRRATDWAMRSFRDSMATSVSLSSFTRTVTASPFWEWRPKAVSQ